MAVIGSLVANLSLNAAAFIRDLNAAGDTLDKTGRRMVSVGRNISTYISAPIVGFGALVVKTSSDFEASMNKLESVSGATGAELAKLREEAKKLGSQIEFGKFSAQDAAEGMTLLAQAGFKTNEIITAMPGLLQLATASQMDLGQSAETVSSILRGYNKDVEELAHVNDVLTKVSIETNAELSDLGEGMKFVGPVASAAGLQFEEVAAALGNLANAGIKAEMGGTALRGAISQLLSPADKAASLLDLYNVKVTDSVGRMRSLTEIVGDFQQGAGGLQATLKTMGDNMGGLDRAATFFGQHFMESAEQVIKAGDEIKATDIVAIGTEIGKGFGLAGDQATGFAEALARSWKQTGEDLIAGAGDTEAFTSTILKLFNELATQGIRVGDLLEIFGDRAGPAMAALITQGSDSLAVLTNKLEESGGTAAKVAATQLQGFSAAMEGLRSSFEGLQIAIGDSGLLQFATDAVKGLTRFVEILSQLDPVTLRWATGIAAVAAAVGPLALILGGVAVALGALLSPIGLLVTAIAGTAGLVAAIIVFRKEIGSAFTDAVNSAVATLVGFKDQALGAVNALVDGIEQAFAGRLAAAFDAINAPIETAKAWFDSLKDYVVGHSVIPDMVRDIEGWMEKLTPAMAGPAKDAAAATASELGKIGDVQGPTIGVSGFDQISDSLMQFVEVTLPDIIARIAAEFEKLPALMTRPLQEGSEQSIATVDGMADSIAGVIETGLVYKASSVLLGFAAAGGPIGIAVAAIGAIVIAFSHWDEIKTLIGPVLDYVSQRVLNVTLVFVDLKDSALTAVQEMVTGISDWLGNKLAAAFDGIAAPIDRTVALFKGMYDAVVGRSYVPDMVNDIQGWMERLDVAMVKPAEKAVNDANAAFARLEAGALKPADIAVLRGALSEQNRALQSQINKTGVVTKELRFQEKLLTSQRLLVEKSAQAFQSQGAIISATSETISGWNETLAEGPAAAADLAQPFVTVSENLSATFTDAFDNILTQGVDSFTDLGRSVQRIFTTLTASIGEQFGATFASLGAFGGPLGSLFGGVAGVGIGFGLQQLFGGLFGGGPQSNKVSLGRGALGVAAAGGTGAGAGAVQAVDKALLELLNAQQQAIANRALRTAANVSVQYSKTPSGNDLSRLAAARIGPTAQALGFRTAAITGGGRTAEEQLAKLSEALNVKQQVGDLVKGFGEFAQQARELKTRFDELKASAKEFGISTAGFDRAARQQGFALIRGELSQLTGEAPSLSQQIAALNERFRGVRQAAKIFGFDLDKVAAAATVARHNLIIAQRERAAAAAAEQRQGRSQIREAILGLLGQTPRFSQQLEQLNLKFADVRIQAQKYGISLDSVTRSQKSAVAALKEQQQAQISAMALSVANPFQQLIDPLQSFLTSLKSADLNPLQQLEAARKDFQRIANLARAGSTIAIGQLQGAGELFARLSEQVGASPGGVSARADVANVIESVLKDIDKAQKEASKGLETEIRKASREQVDTLKEMIQVGRDTLTEIKRLRRS